MSGLLQACAACAGLYFTAVLVVVLPNFTRLFALRFGRAHRVAGVVHLSVLLLGMVDLSVRLLPWLLPLVTTPPLDIRNYSIYGLKLNAFAVYDLVLGVSGILLTYTAATDFGIPKARLRNAASGALDANQTVTREEITEHLFYQILNVSQVVYLRYVYVVGEVFGTKGVVAALLATSSVWLARSIFPTNRFSDNYNRRVLASRLSTSERHGNGTTNATSADLRAFTSFLYRLKKYQYVFLKHVLQHGLNIGVAMESVLRLTLTDSEIANAPAPLVDCVQFRLYWLCVNAAFVFEFFMQTLVKKRMLKQRTMLGANVFLMLTSSMAVFFVLKQTHFPASIVSLALNFLKPGRELRNVLVALAVAVTLESTSVGTEGWPVGTIAALLLCAAPATAVEKRARALGVRARRRI